MLLPSILRNLFLTSATLVVAVPIFPAASPPPLETAAGLNKLASSEQAEGRWRSAEELLQQAYLILEQNKAAQSSLAGFVLSNMGVNAQSRGHYGEAGQDYARAFALIQDHKGQASEEMARLLKNSALLSFETGKLQDALEKNIKAMEIEEALPLVSVHDKAVTLNNLGLVFALLGRTAEAEKAYAQSIQLQRSDAQLDFEFAKTLNNLAMLEKDEGNLDAARRDEMRALQVAESYGSKQDATMPSILNGLGLIALAQNRLAEAGKFFDKAANLSLKTLGPDSSMYAATLSNLGCAASRQGRHKKGQELFAKALSINEARFGPVHPQISSNLSNMGAELFRQKKYEQAVAQYRRAEQIQEKVFGEQSVQAAQLWRNLAIVYNASDQVDQSEAAYEKAIRCVQAASGPYTPSLSIWLHEYATLLRRDRRFSQAEEAEVQAVRIQVRNTIQANRKAGPGES